MDLPERQSLLFKIVSKKVKVENFGGTSGSLTAGEHKICCYCIVFPVKGQKTSCCS